MELGTQALWVECNLHFLFVCSSFCLDFVSYLLVSIMEFVGEGVGGNFKFEDFWIF